MAFRFLSSVVAALILSHIICIGNELSAQELSLGVQSVRTLHGIALVIDGDTIEVAGKRIRLKGIAAPEGQEPGGAAAKTALVKMIGKGQVSCALAGEHTHGREVGYCYDAGGRDLNRQMVAEGWALACPRYDTRYTDVEPRTGPARRAGYVRPSYC